MSWITVVTTLSTQLTGAFGIPLYVLLVAYGGFQVAVNHRWHPLGYILAGGAVTFSAAWFVNTFLAA